MSNEKLFKGILKERFFDGNILLVEFNDKYKIR